jgi:transposase-like protein
VVADLASSRRHLEREFEQTIHYDALEGMVREVVRTTSLLERTNRELRRKFQ